MLEQFLEVIYEADKQASIREELVEAMKGLPVDELKKIASGEVKLGCGLDGGEGAWLDRFQGSPLYSQALALEEEALNIEMQEQESRQAEREQRNQSWDARDTIRVKKRMLELNMRKGEASVPDPGMPAPGEPADPAPEPAPEPAQEMGQEQAVEKMSAARGAQIIASMRKQAGVVDDFFEAALKKHPQAAKPAATAAKAATDTAKSTAEPAKSTLGRLAKSKWGRRAALAGVGVGSAALVHRATRSPQGKSKKSSVIESMRKQALVMGMEKEALVGNALKLMGGAAKYVGSGAKAAVQGAKGAAGAAPTLMQKAKAGLTGGAQAFGDVATRSPLTAAGLAGGAVGGAALLGGGAGRATAPRR